MYDVYVCMCVRIRLLLPRIEIARRKIFVTENRDRAGGRIVVTPPFTPGRPGAMTIRGRSTNRQPH